MSVHEKFKLSKKNKQTIRFVLLLAATIFLYVVLLLILLASISIVNAGYNFMQLFNFTDVLIIAGIGAGAIVFTSLTVRYKPFNLTARIQQKQISKFLSTARTFTKDEKERAVINITIDKKTSWKSPYSSDDYPMLDSSVADFLEDRLSILPSIQEFLLVVETEMNEKDRNDFAQALRNYYAGKYVVLRSEHRRSTAGAGLFVILGIVVIFASVIARIYNSITETVMNIVGTVFIWEATYIIFVYRQPTIHKRMRYLMLANMDIEFIDKKSQ